MRQVEREHLQIFEGEVMVATSSEAKERRERCY